MLTVEPVNDITPHQFIMYNSRIISCTWKYPKETLNKSIFSASVIGEGGGIPELNRFLRYDSVSATCFT